MKQEAVPGQGDPVSDPSANVIGSHVSSLPEAIADVWPVVDGGGVVTELVRTWEDHWFVRLDADGWPVDEIAQTHHLMPREVFQTLLMPAEWRFIAARRVSRGLAKLEDRLLLRGESPLGDRQQFEVLIRLNDGAGTVIDEIDTCPPYTHVIELGGEFFLVQMRDVATADADAEAATEVVAAGPDPAPAAPTSEPCAQARAAAKPTAASEMPSSDDVAAWVEAAASEEASATPRARRSPPRPSEPENAADLLQALAGEFGDEEDFDDGPSLDGPGVGLAPSLDEGIWGDDDAPPSSTRRPPSRGSKAAGGAGVTMLVSEMKSSDEFEEARAASFAQATAFLTAPDQTAASDDVLSLEQVRAAGCFAWDEFMNLYLPHVGFVAPVPSTTPAAGGEPAEVAFLPRPEATVRPVGWHHLAGCLCPFCTPRD